MTNVKLCVMVVLIELYSFMPLTMTLDAFQGHSGLKQLKLKIILFVFNVSSEEANTSYDC